MQVLVRQSPAGFLIAFMFQGPSGLASEGISRPTPLLLGPPIFFTNLMPAHTPEAPLNAAETQSWPALWDNKNGLLSFKYCQREPFIPPGTPHCLGAFQHGLQNTYEPSKQATGASKGISLSECMRLYRGYILQMVSIG